jgi:pyruvate formate lyase activating enzyme
MKINIGGLQKFSLSDYPGQIAAIIFLRGCNFRCHYCHNHHLWNIHTKTMPHKTVFGFLESRKKQLDGIVITGGEPTIYDDLSLFLKKIKQMGYNVKLNTNGTYPNRLAALIQQQLVDYIAMDIKAPLEKYDSVCMKKVDIVAIQKSIQLIHQSRLPHEFRTTYDPTLLSKQDLVAIKETLIPSESRHCINPCSI